MAGNGRRYCEIVSGFVAAVWIADGGDRVIRARRNGHGDPDQAARAQQAIGGGPPRKRRDIDVVIAVRAVDCAEDRVQAGGLVETQLDVQGGDGHAVARLVAGRAASAVATQTLEEQPGLIDASAGRAVSLGSASQVEERSPVGDESSGSSMAQTGPIQFWKLRRSPREKAETPLRPCAWCETKRCAYLRSPPMVWAVQNRLCLGKRASQGNLAKQRRGIQRGPANSRRSHACARRSS